MGVAGIKVDFFGGDGQSMIAYYHDILQDAASHQLMLNFHGATLPRGWHRTYPHLMTVEAIKGGEFITEVKFLDGYPEEYAVLARRKGETWHIAGINGTDKEISVRLDLSFATGEQGVLLYDGPDGKIRKGEASAGPTVVRLPGSGGFVIKT